MSTADLQVEVVCAWPDRVWSRRLQLPAGSTIANALDACIDQDPIDADALSGKVGIFGRIVGDAHELSDGDRIELYRPLLADPREARRRRVAEQR